MRSYFSLPNITAGFVGVLVGFTSSAVLVFQAATTAGATQAEISSWLFALGIGIGLTCIGLSLRYRVPILTGWSTPGAALLITCLSGVSMAEAIGAFIFSALLTIVSGATGIFEKVMSRIPSSLTSAMLAGILLHFGINLFASMQHQFLLVSAMLFIYLIGKRMRSRYVIVFVLLFGVCLAKTQGLFNLNDIHLAFASPIFTFPTFSLSALISIGIPLFVVTMTTQNIPGAAVINACGYKPPISPLINWTGIATLLLAPFGSYGVCLTAMTAAICMGKEADNNPDTRYKATIFAGICWLSIGLLGATIVALFSAFPKELISALAGLALLTTIGNSLKTALDIETQREPALITILVSASGVSLLGVGAAFWGLITGIIAFFILNWKKKSSPAITTPA